MNLFTWNSPYYHLLKYLLFLLKHPVYGGMEIQHYSFLTWALDGTEWSHSHFAKFMYEWIKSPWNSFNMKLVAAQSQFWYQMHKDMHWTVWP